MYAALVPLDFLATTTSRYSFVTLLAHFSLAVLPLSTFGLAKHSQNEMDPQAVARTILSYALTAKQGHTRNPLRSFEAVIRIQVRGRNEF